MAYVYNVKDYGARGDNSTDDTTAVQNTINAANAAGGGVVYAPFGIYLISTYLTMYSNVSVVGDGKYLTTFKWKSGTGSIPGSGGAAYDGHGLFYVNALTGVEFIDIGIDCNYAGQSPTTSNTNGVYILGPSLDIHVYNCFIQGCNGGTNGDFGNGVRVHASSNGNKCKRIRVENCEFYNILCSFAVQFSQAVEQCSANNNWVHDCLFGIDWSTGNYNCCNNNNIENLTANSSIGISCTYGANTTINGNVCKNVGYGISGHFQDDTVTGNVLIGKGTGIGVGIQQTSDTNGQNTITGNYIRNFAKGFESVGAAFDEVISANQIRGCPIGMDIGGTSQRNIITGNNIAGAGTNTIKLGASTTKNVITANQLGASTGTISDAGSANTTTGNFTT